MATTIFGNSFDADLDGWEANEGAALDGAGGITFAAATAPNSYISRTVEYTGSEAYITFRITFSASATDNFYLSVLTAEGATIAAFIGGEVAICGPEAVGQLFYSEPPSLPAGATPVTLLAGQNDASLVFTSSGAMLFLNGAQVTPLLPGLTTSSFANAGPVTGTLTIPSSFVIDSAALLATDALPTPPEEEPPEEETPPVNISGLPVGLDTSWEAAQERAQGTAQGVAWLVRDDYNGGPQEVEEYRAFPTQEGVSGAEVFSYGYGGDAGGEVRLVLDGNGGMTFDPETYAARMMLDVWVPSAPAGAIEITFKVKMEPYRYGGRPLDGDVRIDLGAVGLRLSAWGFKGGVTRHAVRRLDGDWQPDVPVAAGLEVDAEGNTLIIMTFLEGVVMISDGAETVAVPTGVPLYDGTGAIRIRLPLTDIVSVDYLQVSGVGGGGSAFWTNFVQSFEVP